jgi:general secretion pathway protein B
MSFILDALKKADRERNLAKVPTLTTVHVPVYITGRRIAIWLVAGALLCGGLVVWFLRPSPTSVPVADVSPSTSVGVSPERSRADADSEPLPRQPAPASVPRLETSPASPAAAPRRQASPQPERRTESSRSANQSLAGPPAKDATEPAEHRALEPRPIVSAPPPPTPRTEPAPSTAARPAPPDTAAAPPTAAPPRRPTLHEASAKMTLDVFVYTDVEADRMAVINGRRYVIGQFVDGLYRVDGITPEGVVLTFEGERVVLQP